MNFRRGLLAMKKSKRQSFLPVVITFCIALLVRITYNFTVARSYYPLNDSFAYQSVAFHMLDEHCYCLNPGISTASRAPFWPLLIAGISLIVGRANIFDRLFLCLADAGTCVFVYLFAHDLFNKRIGLIAGLIACIYPTLYIYTGWMYTETLYTFLLIAICYCIFLIQRSEGRSRLLPILCGILLALLALTRPNGILVIGLVILWAAILVWRKCLRTHIFIHVAFITLIACALIAPWTIRNYLVSHSFVPIATGDGTVLLGSYNDLSLAYNGLWLNPASVYPTKFKRSLPDCTPVCEVAQEDLRKDTAIQWIESHLSQIPPLMVDHLRNFFTPYTGESDMPLNRFTSKLSSKIVRDMSDRLPIVIFLLAALGLVVTLKQYWRELLFVYLIILATLGESLVYYGTSRFRTPIEPLLILLAAGSLWWLTQDAPGTLRWHMKQRH
jgi:4-amino-4-deoxy-L-arabinose transferase-like glycosyltransferase